MARVNASLTIKRPSGLMTNAVIKSLTSLTNGIYADAIDKAAMMLLAMSVRPDLESALVNEVEAAVIVRGGRINHRRFRQFDLGAVLDEVVARAMAILSAAVRERLPGIADEMDDAFGDKLRSLLVPVAQLFPTV
jgi:hypothetical protein